MAKKEKNEFINDELDEMYENDKSNVEDLIIIPDDLETGQEDLETGQEDLEEGQEDLEEEQEEPEMTINNDDGTLYYEVVKGDNLYTIASMFNIDYKKLYQDNKDIIGPNMNYIEVGMLLLIDKK